MKVRIATDDEWDRLVTLTDGNNKKMHWWRMASWIWGASLIPQEHRPDFGGVRGNTSADAANFNVKDYRATYIGFRPAIEYGHDDFKGLLLRDGDVVTVGTLYMDGKPVRIPKNPVRSTHGGSGDVTPYIPGATLELREMIMDANYQVEAIYIGNGVFVADRNLLCMISYEDIMGACGNDIAPDRELSAVMDVIHTIQKEHGRTAVQQAYHRIVEAGVLDACDASAQDQTPGPVIWAAQICDAAQTDTTLVLAAMEEFFKEATSDKP